MDISAAVHDFKRQNIRDTSEVSLVSLTACTNLPQAFLNFTVFNV